MNIHKFNVKPKFNFQKTIKWLIPQDVSRKNKYEYVENFLSRKYYITA